MTNATVQSTILEPTRADLGESRFSSYPGVEIAATLTFDEVWAVLRHAGFLYPEKEQALQPVIREVEQSFGILLSQGKTLLKTLVVRSEDTLRGHLSMLRAFRRTWMVQHLAACHEGSIRLATARILTLAAVRYAELSAEIQFVKIFFRPNNRWPARVFGGFASRINDPCTSDLRKYNIMKAPAVPSAVRERSIRPAQPQDLLRIEEYFLARGRLLSVEADDLRADALTLDEICRKYRDLGLGRHREVIVAECGGRLVGFALLQISSFGLNLGELTNTFSIYMIEPVDACRIDLIEVARSRYAELGRPYCTALSEDDDVPAFEATGFDRVKEYLCWTFGRAQFQPFNHYLLKIFHIS